MMTIDSQLKIQQHNLESCLDGLAPCPLELHLYNSIHITYLPSSFVDVLEQTVHRVLLTSISTSVDHNESVNARRQSTNVGWERWC